MGREAAPSADLHPALLQVFSFGNSWPGRRGRGGCPVSLQEKVMGLCLPGAGQKLVGAVQESGVKDVPVLCAV